MNLPYCAPFTLGDIENWVAVNRPAEVGMNDRQYAYYAALMSVNTRDIKGVPIAFLDAPKR